jgi:AraC family transcriptional regulator
MEGDRSMEPAIVELRELKLVGMKYQGKNENGEITMLWKEFMARLPEIENRVADDVCYGFETFEGSTEPGEFVYIASVQVRDLDEIPAGMVSRVVPSTRYAAFAIPAVVTEIPKAICDIYERRLPESRLEPTGDWDFEYYDRDFAPDTAEGRLYLYVPVK